MGMKLTDVWEDIPRDDALDDYSRHVEAVQRELEARRAAKRSRSRLILMTLRARRRQLERRPP
jgi:hypothetical protein